MSDSLSPDPLEVLSAEDRSLLDHVCERLPEERLAGTARGPAGWQDADRSPAVLRSLGRLYGHGRLGGTGYLSLLPVDHGIAYGGGTAFAANPVHFDPESIVRLALEGGCSGVVTTHGVLGAVARRYARKLPLVLKLNHHQTLSRPPEAVQVLFARIDDAERVGCAAVAATVYFGGPDTRRELRLVSRLFSEAHRRGMATVLFCYLHHESLRVDGTDYALASDLTAQANYEGAAVEADLIKQKQPTVDGGFLVLDHWDDRRDVPDRETLDALVGSHPIDRVRYQVVHGLGGRCGLINSGGPAGGDALERAVRAAVVNRRAGGIGLIAGRKVFQPPREEGLRVLHAIQNVYLDDRIDLA